MSMFNRAVKIQFNRMKYTDLKSKRKFKLLNLEPFSERFYVDTTEVIWARMFFLSLGFITCAGLMNFDINVKYLF